MYTNKKLSVVGSSIRSMSSQTGNRGLVKRSANQEKAFMGSGILGMGTGTSSMNVYASGPLASNTLLNSLVPEQEDYLRMYYRDIYYTDAVAGATVDMLSTFPFSDYTLTGVAQDRLDKYVESMTRLNIRSLMPSVSTAYLVDGSSASSLIFNRHEKVFIDLIMHDINNCVIEQLPLYGTEPTILVRNTEAMIKFMASDSPQAKAVRDRLPESLKNTLRSQQYRLDPLTTLYLARRPLPGCEPISFLKRILPIYLLEKVLYRGTIVEANKRQRSMLHVQMGDDNHTYTPEEMAETVNQFQLADLDPLGAVIGTRVDVQASELRQGGDFWKWTDTIEGLVSYKLRALGISEAFLAGDANYSNSETALSVFMENSDAYRSMLTYEVFTNKIFPLVAVSNDFFKPGKEVNTSNRTKMNHQLTNHSDLEIPTLRWHKRLEAKTEDNIMDVLTALQEKGFPIPMRMWAAAGGIDMTSYLQDLNQDKTLREAVAKAAGVDAKKIGLPAGDMGDEEGGEFASLTQPIRRVNLMDRQFGAASELKGKTKTGKDKAILNQLRANKEINHNIAKAASKLSKDINAKNDALARVVERLGSIPNLITPGTPLQRSGKRRIF